MLHVTCMTTGSELFLFVDSESPKSWYERLGFKYIEKSLVDKLVLHVGDHVEKMYKPSCSK